MLLFHLDARSMDGKEKEDTKALAVEAGKLLRELECLPNFTGLLDRFANLATTWENCCETLEQHKRTDEKGNRRAQGAQKRPHRTPRGDQGPDPPPRRADRRERGVPRDRRRRTHPHHGQAASAQKALKIKVEADGSPNAEFWFETVQEMLDRANEDAENAFEADGGRRPRGRHPRLQARRRRVPRGRPKAGAAEGQPPEGEDLTRCAGCSRPAPQDFSMFVGRIQVNLKAVGSDPRRDEGGFKSCKKDFESVRDRGRKALRAKDTGKLLEAVNELEKIEDRSLEADGLAGEDDPLDAGHRQGQGAGRPALRRLRRPPRRGRGEHQSARRRRTQERRTRRPPHRPGRRPEGQCGGTQGGLRAASRTSRKT